MTWSSPQRALIDELIVIGADVVSRHLTLASGGNLSVRDPDNPEQFIVTGLGTWFDRLTQADFSLVHLDGSVVSGMSQPSSEWKLHQRAYLGRQDIGAVIHVHPQYSVLIDAMGHALRLLTLDHVSYVKSVGRVPFAPNGSDELGDSVAAQLNDHNCVILAHHGSATVADTLEMAYRRVLNLEEAATNTYRALLTGDTTTTFPHEHVLSVHS